MSVIDTHSMAPCWAAVSSEPSGHQKCRKVGRYDTKKRVLASGDRADAELRYKSRHYRSTSWKSDLRMVIQQAITNIPFRCCHTPMSLPKRILYRDEISHTIFTPTHVDHRQLFWHPVNCPQQRTGVGEMSFPGNVRTQHNNFDQLSLKREVSMFLFVVSITT